MPFLPPNQQRQSTEGQVLFYNKSRIKNHAGVVETVDGAAVDWSLSAGVRDVIVIGR